MICVRISGGGAYCGRMHVGITANTYAIPGKRADCEECIREVRAIVDNAKAADDLISGRANGIYYEPVTPR